MANYYGMARTNYFKVNDVEAFRRELAVRDLDVDVVTRDTYPGTVALLSNHEGGQPSSYVDDEGEDHELDLARLIGEHLAEGWVAVLVETGHEKLCYLVGRAVAVNSAGKTVTVDLDDIYEHARALGEHLTEAGF